MPPTSTCRRSRSRSTASTRSRGRAGAPIDGWMPRCAARPPVDVVHVQADFWGAFIGHRFAARHAPARGAHDAQPRRRRHRGDRAVPGARAARAQRVAAPGARRRRARRSPSAATAGRTCARFAGRSDAVTAPSSHFARRLEEHGRAGSRGIAAWRDLPRGRRDLERHRRRRCSMRRCAAARRRARSGTAAVRVARTHEPREAAAAVPRGARRVGRARRRRGDRRRRAAARGAAARREAAARAHRSSSRAGCRTPRRCAASRPPTPWCRPRSASRRRA